MAPLENETQTVAGVGSLLESSALEKGNVGDGPSVRTEPAAYASMAEQLAHGPKETWETWLQALSAFLIYAGTW
jgi:hypothetical protein